MNRREILVYVFGAFRAPSYWEQEQNVRRAEALALEAWRAGFAVICPHCNTRFFQGAAPDDVWIQGDLVILARCDALLATPGFEESKGSAIEILEARQEMIPVFYSLQALITWANERGAYRELP